MSTFMGRCAVAALAGLAALAPVQAMVIAGPEGSRAQGRQMVAVDRAAPASAAHGVGLSRGVIESVHPGKSVVGIAGQLVELHPDKLRVIGTHGRQESGPGVLRKGMPVRFALDPAGRAGEQKIVLIYIER